MPGYLKEAFFRLIKTIYYQVPVPIFSTLVANIPAAVSVRDVLQAWLHPFQKPPVLLISYPRSGSSWIGEVLGTAPDLAYFREPITQALGQKFKYRPLTDPNRDLKTFLRHVTYGDFAFSGIPVKGVYISYDPEDLVRAAKKHQRLLLKEVNPLSLDLYLARYQPIVLLLIRHPAAIGDSYARMGWQVPGWKEFGYNYGLRINQALRSLTGHPAKILLFEELALLPQREFREIFQFIGVPEPENISQVIEVYTKQDPPGSRPYQTRRYSAREIEKWRENLSSAVIQEIKEGYLAADPSYYRQETDW